MLKPVKRAKSFIGQYAGEFRYAREIEFSASPSRICPEILQKAE